MVSLARPFMREDQFRFRPDSHYEMRTIQQAPSNGTNHHIAALNLLPEPTTEPGLKTMSLNHAMRPMMFCIPGGFDIKVIVSPPPDEADRSDSTDIKHTENNYLASGAIDPQMSLTGEALDHTKLMPPRIYNFPRSHSIERSKSVIVQQVTDIRVWLIEFLNSKAHTLPPSLRIHIMDLYEIDQDSLDPIVVDKLKAGMEDEGLSLEQDSPSDQSLEGSDAESLRLLKEAFSSRLATFPPRGDETSIISSVKLARNQGTRIITNHSKQKSLGDHEQPSRRLSLRRAVSTPNLTRHSSLSSSNVRTYSPPTQNGAYVAELDWAPSIETVTSFIPRLSRSMTDVFQERSRTGLSGALVSIFTGRGQRRAKKGIIAS